MDLLSMVLNAGGGEAVRRLSQSFGLNENQTSSAVGSLLPALGQALARNASTSSGVESLLGALASGGHERYLDDPATLGAAETVLEGNGILGHILGSKDVSRQVARNAAAQTGVGEDILKKMLPVVATMVMGALSKQRSSTDAQALGASEPLGGLAGMLGQFFDTGQGGSAISGILGLASKLFK